MTQKQKQILSLLFSRNVLSFEEYQNALEKEIKYVCNTSNNHLFSFYRDSILDEVRLISFKVLDTINESFISVDIFTIP